MKFFKQIAAATVVATTVLGTTVSVSQAEELKLANFMSPNHPYENGVFQPFAAQVHDATGGALSVRVYSGGELGAGPVDQVNRVIEGLADVAFVLPGYTASLFPMTLLAELPGVLDTETGTQQLWEHTDLIANDYKRVVMVSLWSNSESVLYTKTPVRTLADIKGLKIRVPSRNAGLLVESWGATAVSMPISEMYNALQTGVLDGTLVDSTATSAFKLGEVTNYITRGMEATITPFLMVMNRRTWDGLSDEEKAAVAAAGKDASFAGNRVQSEVAAAGLEQFRAMDGHEVIDLSEAAAAEFNAASSEVLAAGIKEVADLGLPAQAYVDAVMAE